MFKISLNYLGEKDLKCPDRSVLHQLWGGTYQTRSLGSLNLAVQKKFYNDKITMKIAANDVLYTSNWRVTQDLKIYA